MNQEDAKWDLMSEWCLVFQLQTVKQDGFYLPSEPSDWTRAGQWVAMEPVCFGRHQPPSRPPHHSFMLNPAGRRIRTLLTTGRCDGTPRLITQVKGAVGDTV